MMAVTEEVEVWLHREPVDFRRQINGLVLIVEQEMEADPFAKRVYAFTNRRRDRARLLDGIDFFRLRPHEEIFYESTL